MSLCDPLLHVDPNRLEFRTQYYNQEVRRNTFSLPNSIKEWTK